VRGVRRNQGFTFIETLIALTIMAFVVTVISLLYLSGYQDYTRERDRIEVQENLRIAMARMAAKIRQADPEAPGSVSITDSGRKIRFTLSFSDEKIRYQFDAQDKEIEEVKEDPGGYTLPFASCITDLVFTREGNSITVTIEGEKGKSGKVRLRTEVNLRVGENG